MSNSSALWFANPGANFYNSVATQSLRFDQGSSSHLTFTPSSAGNQKKCTISAWVKRSKIGDSGATEDVVFHAGTASGHRGHLRFYEDHINWNYYNGSSWILYLITTGLYRDTTNWYHLCANVDTVAGTAKLWVNGVEPTLSNNTIPSSSQDLSFADDIEHQIGERGYGTTGYFDGYIADVHFIDGDDLEYSEFAEFKNGVLIPKKYTGSYGTNGFHLEFKETGTGTASTSTIGADTSGNTNHWTSNNLASADSNFPDCPENNFCTLKGDIDHQTAGTASDGNLKLTNAGSNAWSVATCTFAVSSGKWWYEACASGSIGIGYNIGYQNVETYTDAATDGKAEGSFFYYPNTSGTAYYYVGTADSGTVDNDIDYDVGDDFVVGDVVGIALDLDSSPPTVRHYVNGVAQDAAKEIPSGNTLTPYLGLYSASAVTTFNFGQDPTFGGISVDGSSADATDGNGKGKFYDTPPSGFLALCSANLPAPTIGPNADTQADDYFTTHTYTANNQTAQTRTGVGMQADWLWFKQRSRADSHALYNTVRGIDKSMRITTDTEFDDSNSETGVTAIGTDGFTLGTDAQAWVNYQSDTMVAWLWKAGGNHADVSGNFIKDGVAFTPTQGTIDASYISVNTTSCFSIVQFTSDISSDVGETGTPPTIAHGIGVKPTLVIVKDTDGGSYPHWNVWHKGYQPDATYLNYQLFLQSDAASNNAGWHRTDTGFTTNLFTPPRYQYNETGKTYICYVFAEVEGYSKFGTYKGNGSTDGTFIYTGFTPKWIMAKRVDSADNWAIYDSDRDTYNVRDSYLYADSSQAEATYSTAIVDFLSNGFKWRGAVNFGNNSSGTYVYMAFASLPFKQSNAI